MDSKSAYLRLLETQRDRLLQVVERLLRESNLTHPLLSQGNSHVDINAVFRMLDVPTDSPDEGFCSQFESNDLPEDDLNDTRGTRSNPNTPESSNNDAAGTPVDRPSHGIPPISFLTAAPSRPYQATDTSMDDGLTLTKWQGQHASIWSDARSLESFRVLEHGPCSSSNQKIDRTSVVGEDIDMYDPVLASLSEWSGQGNTYDI